MDVINERKVFELLSAAAGRAGTPQCFLLTPKLLPALPFSKDCCVLQVVKGPHMQLALPFTKARAAVPSLQCQAFMEQPLLRLVVIVCAQPRSCCALLLRDL